MLNTEGTEATHCGVCHDQQTCCSCRVGTVALMQSSPDHVMLSLCHALLFPRGQVLAQLRQGTKLSSYVELGCEVLWSRWRIQAQYRTAACLSADLLGC